jgi:HK97 family phage prohead protease
MAEVMERVRQGCRFQRELNLADPVIMEVEEQDDGTAEFGGYLLKWDDTAEIRDFFGTYYERFSRGAFEKTFRERGPTGNNAIKLLRQHETRGGSFSAGKFLELYEDSTGPAFRARTIPTKPTGENLAIELREGVINTMSIGFDPIAELYLKEENTYDVKEARMYEASPVYWPAYESATIDQVRSIEEMIPVFNRMMSVLENGGTLSAEQIGQLTQLRSRIASLLDGPDEGSPEEESETIESEATVNDHARRVRVRLRLAGLA